MKKEEIVQFNVYISETLANKVRHEAIDTKTSNSELTAAALRYYFEYQDKQKRKQSVSSSVEPQKATDTASRVLAEQTSRASGKKSSTASPTAQTSGRAKPARKRRGVQPKLPTQAP